VGVTYSDGPDSGVAEDVEVRVAVIGPLGIWGNLAARAAGEKDGAG
jgi:hypothetical protein